MSLGRVKERYIKLHNSLAMAQETNNTVMGTPVTAWLGPVESLARETQERLE
jgi:hypothetical protein